MAMTHLIKKLFKNFHANKKQKSEHQSGIKILLSKLSYLLIEMYENQMNHPNDVLNQAKSNLTSPYKI